MHKNCNDDRPGTSANWSGGQPSNMEQAGAAPRRRGRRHRDERGLPTDDALKSLATTYLESQQRFWPELAAKGELPPAGEEHLDQLVDDFKERFLAKAELVHEDAIATMPSPLAASYLRYSDEGSNPRSLAQQLQLQLERARQNGHFIPWAHVYADAAITGTIANRRGYQMAKQAIQQGGDGFAGLYIDEIGRASRDAIEALRLGRLVEQCRKRLIGVSDGFDSDTPHAKMMLSLFAMLHEWFIDQLRSKVNRGMADAFRQGKNIQPPSVGYKLVPAQDQHGNPGFDNDGDPVMTKVVDEETADYVREAFVLYGEKGWSGGRIARYFNEAKVQGKVTWDGSRIRELLTRATYVGVEYYRMTRQVRDRETGSVKTIKKPEEEWLKRESPHLRIVSDELWEKVQHRRKECADAFTNRGKGEKSRTEVYPTTLVRPVCGCCGKELMLGRSGQYGSFCCLNGIHGKHGCTFKGYKSVRIVETVVLDHLRQEVFSEECLARLLSKANQYLAKEAKRPRKDLAPLKKQIKAEEGKRDRLVAILTQEGEEDLDAVVKTVRQHERRLKELRRQLKEATARDMAPPPPMEKADLAMLLDDLRGLLNQDIAAAAPVLRELLGPVVVRQEKEPGKTRPTWHAEFTVNLVPVLAKLTAKRNCPTAGTWEFLNTRGWTMDEKCKVRLEMVPAQVRLGPESMRLRAQGASVESIARALKTSWETARAALSYAETGTMTPPPKSGKKNRGPRRRFPKYVETAEE